MARMAFMRAAVVTMAAGRPQATTACVAFMCARQPRLEYFALRSSAAPASLGACRYIRHEAPRLSGSSLSFGPGAAQTALAHPDSGPEPHLPLWLVPSTGPGADSIGSSCHSGPEPYRPQWLVPPMRARSRVDLGSSHHRASTAVPHWLVPSTVPGAASVNRL